MAKFGTLVIIYFYFIIETDYNTSLSRVESLSEAKKRAKTKKSKIKKVKTR